MIVGLGANAAEEEAEHARPGETPERQAYTA
jgi:hypothetical protein